MEPQNTTQPSNQSGEEPGVIPPHQPTPAAVPQSANQQEQPAVQTPVYNQQPSSYTSGQGQVSDKEFMAAVLFAWFLGNFGADRFYLGKTGTAIAKLLTFGGLGLWNFYDIVMLVFGKTRDKQGLPLKDYAKYRKGAIIAFVIMIILQFISILLAVIMLATTLSTFQSVQGKARDTERQTDIKAITAQLEGFYAANGAYPSLTELNTASFRSQHFRVIDDETFTDPTSTSDVLTETPAPGLYAYEASPEGCSSVSRTNPCMGYTATATLDDGSTYVKVNL